MALASMVFATTTFVVLRYLRQLHYSVVTLFFGIWGSAETLLLSLLVSQLEIPQEMNDWLLAGALAGLTFIGQTCMTLAFKFEQAGTISLCRTTDVIFAFMWQFLFLGIIPDKFRFLTTSFKL
jgi:drug/metabolite transporter (DMT)-like permease